MLCAGVPVPNPSEMLASTQMQQLLDTLQTSFDYIIFDTPPLNVVSDAIPLAKMSDGVVLIAREMVSTYTELDKAVNALQMVDAKILGFVYNDSGKADGGSKDKKYYNKYGYNRYAKKTV